MGGVFSNSAPPPADTTAAAAAAAVSPANETNPASTVVDVKSTVKGSPAVAVVDVKSTVKGSAAVAVAAEPLKNVWRKVGMIEMDRLFARIVAHGQLGNLWPDQCDTKEFRQVVADCRELMDGRREFRKMIHHKRLPIWDDISVHLKLTLNELLVPYQSLLTEYFNTVIKPLLRSTLAVSFPQHKLITMSLDEHVVEPMLSADEWVVFQTELAIQSTLPAGVLEPFYSEYDESTPHMDRLFKRLDARLAMPEEQRVDANVAQLSLVKLSLDNQNRLTNIGSIVFKNVSMANLLFTASTLANHKPVSRHECTQTTQPAICDVCRDLHSIDKSKPHFVYTTL